MSAKTRKKFDKLHGNYEQLRKYREETGNFLIGVPRSELLGLVLVDGGAERLSEHLAALEAERKALKRIRRLVRKTLQQSVPGDEAEPTAPAAPNSAALTPTIAKPSRRKREPAAQKADIPQSGNGGGPQVRAGTRKSAAAVADKPLILPSASSGKRARGKTEKTEAASAAPASPKLARTKSVARPASAPTSRRTSRSGQTSARG